MTLIWATWHTPFFAYRYQFGPVELIFFHLGIFAGSIWLTSLYNSTGGSVLMVILWRVSWNIVNALAAVVPIGVVALLTAQVMIAALVVVFVWKPDNLSPTGKHSEIAAPTVPPTSGEAPIPATTQTEQPPKVPVSGGARQRARPSRRRAPNAGRATRSVEPHPQPPLIVGEGEPERSRQASAPNALVTYLGDLHRPHQADGEQRGGERRLLIERATGEGGRGERSAYSRFVGGIGATGRGRHVCPH